MNKDSSVYDLYKLNILRAIIVSIVLYTTFYMFTNNSRMEIDRSIFPLIYPARH